MERAQQIRGLNRNHHHLLKEVFKGAALNASRRPGILKEFYERWVAAGVRPELARLTLARKMAALTLAVWKPPK